jgi:hypothetical protein
VVGQTASGGRANSSCYRAFLQPGHSVGKMIDRQEILLQRDVTFSERTDVL